MMKRYYLGIDTSCYTTSCAIVDSDFHIVGEARKILKVKLGERGLQQSNMVFQHTKALPKLMSELPQVPISGIGVSGFPRREERSYGRVRTGANLESSYECAFTYFCTSRESYISCFERF